MALAFVAVVAMYVGAQSVYDRWQFSRKPNGWYVVSIIVQGRGYSGNVDTYLLDGPFNEYESCEKAMAAEFSYFGGQNTVGCHRLTTDEANRIAAREPRK